MCSTKELILYKNFENGRLFYGFTGLIEHCKDSSCDKAKMAEE